MIMRLNPSRITKYGEEFIETWKVWIFLISFTSPKYIFFKAMFLKTETS